MYMHACKYIPIYRYTYIFMYIFVLYTILIFHMQVFYRILIFHTYIFVLYMIINIICRYYI